LDERLYLGRSWQKNEGQKNGDHQRPSLKFSALHFSAQLYERRPGNRDPLLEDAEAAVLAFAEKTLISTG
jgi:hypothetical protein